jgi:hypothetical protein
MKTLVCIVALMCLSCTVLLAQSSDSSAAKPDTAAGGSKKGLPCAKANPASGYAAPVKLPGRKEKEREIKVYNVDSAPPHDEKHDPVCLSKSGDDAILWVSGSSKKFKVTIHAAKDQDSTCGQHPFKKGPPNEIGDGYFSGSLGDVPLNCVYDVEFQFEGGEKSDPHIQTTP